MSNLGFRQAMQDAGITVVETAVGDRYVLEAMRAGSYVSAASSPGTSSCWTTPPPATACSPRCTCWPPRPPGGPRWPTLAAVMTRYPQVLVNVPGWTSRGSPPHRKWPPRSPPPRRNSAPSGRVLVRPSGTEPAVRVMVEAIDPDQRPPVLPTAWPPPSSRGLARRPSVRIFALIGAEIRTLDGRRRIRPGPAGATCAGTTRAPPWARARSAWLGRRDRAAVPWRAGGWRAGPRGWTGRRAAGRSWAGWDRPGRTWQAGGVIVGIGVDIVDIAPAGVGAAPHPGAGGPAVHRGRTRRAARPRWPPASPPRRRWPKRSAPRPGCAGPMWRSTHDGAGRPALRSAARWRTRPRSAGCAAGTCRSPTTED